MRKITFEEAIKALKEGKRIYEGETQSSFYYMDEDKQIWTESTNSDYKSIGYSIGNDEIFYLDEPDEFKITETGEYKTRDGRRAFVAYIQKCNGSLFGIIEGDEESEAWHSGGNYTRYDDDARDIVSKWEGSE